MYSSPYRELPVSANQEDVRDAFRRLSKKYHPDRNPGSKDRFEKINVGKWFSIQPIKLCMIRVKSICMTEWASRR
jgi:hypothetical protein